ncbi:cytochrome c biogenesis protein ResB [Halalkalibacter sp. APA_J-10(15)]|uniref:cytochrome c biogenesis protein ResB n=1 Tax=Halalkalibacter sp. APA_J-10(15) TaxID=2933805 RepID=UPI001FF1BC0D|nr:cytochrome c biogenesis protein ResB [Halalkalibacter sp. APA_J-10(15)]MCK0472173.1 cytochrome c biogenesis protein ResB [Halalkalibacter sp. APA_J-10(15)]
MSQIKCECGHLNQEGTQVCEACGNPIGEYNESTKLLDMKYEGVARRSQTYTTTMIDKVWMFFSSVKVGIWIIVITLIASSLGTIYPQEMYIPGGVSPTEHYEAEYGFTGKLYYELGLHNLYGTWWYMLLVAALGVSILIASIDRFFPLYRALKNQRVSKHRNFLKRQRLYGYTEVNHVDEKLQTINKKLKQKKYKIREENGNVLAEKNRFARWGPYVNHIGLIIFLIGCMLRYFPGMYVDDHMWIREGETAEVPHTDGQFHVENEQFIIEVYDEENELYREALNRAEGAIASNYQTNAVLYERQDTGIIGDNAELVEIERYPIRVNEPLTFSGFSLYQMDYKLNELSSMSFTLENKETGEQFGQLDVDLSSPQAVYDLGEGYYVEIREYFQDFYLNNNVPSTRSNVPNNPVFIFDMYTPDTPEGEVSFVGIQTNLEPLGENEYKMSFVDLETNHVTALVLRKDYTFPLLIIGGVIFMIGLIQGSYWAHRRIWFQQIDNEFIIAGHTNKNYLSLRKDIDEILEGTTIPSPVDQLENEEEEKEITN